MEEKDIIGKRVRVKPVGPTGTVTGLAMYAYGSTQVLIQPDAVKGQNVPEPKWHEYNAVDVI